MFKNWDMDHIVNDSDIYHIVNNPDDMVYGAQHKQCDSVCQRSTGWNMKGTPNGPWRNFVGHRIWSLKYIKIRKWNSFYHTQFTRLKAEIQSDIEDIKHASRTWTYIYRFLLLWQLYWFCSIHCTWSYWLRFFWLICQYRQ